MTMSIARLSAQSGLKYLFKTTMMDDLTTTPADATTYYMKAGTPQGRWLGSGLQGINRTSGDAVTETDAKAIFDHATHPDTGGLLGRPHGQPTVVQNSHGRAETRHAVVGFDLTFSVPKSVSVLWALSPAGSRTKCSRPTTTPSAPPCNGWKHTSSTQGPAATASPISARAELSLLPSTTGSRGPGIRSSIRTWSSPTASSASLTAHGSRSTRGLCTRLR